MIPTSHLFDQSLMTTLLDNDPMVQEYRSFFSFLDWSVVDQWQAERSARGRPGHPISAYLKAFLIRQCEGMLYTSQLRRFLVKHPLLIIELGFDLVLDSNAPYGFDVEQTLPCRYWLTEKLCQFDPNLLSALFQSTVAALHQQFPTLGETVAFDVKHIYAWVKENNWRVWVPERYDKTRIPAGDPDCRLGVKRSSNQKSSDEPASPDQQPSTEATEGSSKEKKELLWGYGSGVAAAIVPGVGDVVLAEYTQPFNEGDVTYFRPLYDQAVVALSRFPTNLTADAAFDAWYVYQAAARHGGIAAVPLNPHGKTIFEPDGVPRCPVDLSMHPTYQFAHPNGYRAQLYRCPLYFPEPKERSCDHPQFRRAKGCVKHINIEPGGLQRILLDRKSAHYKDLYRQRTCCERINSQAQALGIERPKVRNRQSVAHLNTFIYIIINVRVLRRAKSTQKVTR